MTKIVMHQEELNDTFSFGEKKKKNIFNNTKK